MIVNPQLFNYRLIISSLVIALIALGSYNYVNYTTLQENQNFIEQEKHLIESELSEMIKSYDAIYSQNDIVNKQLEASRFKTDSVLESLKALKFDVSLISKYRKQIKFLKVEKIKIFEALEALKEENLKLVADADLISKTLHENQLVSKEIVQKNTVLEEENKALRSTLKEAEVLSISGLEAEGVKRVTSSKKIINTKYAKRAKQLHVCFNLDKNKFTAEGVKNIYIQILDPKNNIVADKGVARFGKSSLIYTDKASVDYNNQDIEVCKLITANANEVFSKGSYFVTVFHDQKPIGKTTVDLK